MFIEPLRIFINWINNDRPGSYYVSPHSARDFKGRFTIENVGNDHLTLGDNFKETRLSEEVFDPHQFVKDMINWVQEDTSYDHPLNLTSQEDFDVSG